MLHFPRYDKSVSRLNAAEVDMFVGPDYLITLPNEPLQALSYLFERCRANEEFRDSIFSKGPGYLLYKIVDDGVDASFPMLAKMGNKLERIEEEIFEGQGGAEVVRDISNVKQEIINFRKIVRPQRTAFRDLERNKARYIAEDLDIYFEDIIDASERAWDLLENYKEVVEGLEATNESAIAHRTNETFRVLTAISLIFLPLTLIASIWGMNVGVPGEQSKTAFWVIMVVMLAVVLAVAGFFRAPGLAVIEDEPRVAALRRSDEARRMLVIVNPVATKMSDRIKGLVVYALQGRYDVTVAETTGRGHATELCRTAAAEHYDVVVAFGGDGTVNEAANGLAGSPTALTCLPGGSNNVVAKLLGIPTDVVDATEHLLKLADRWEPRTVDLGVVNERMFTFAAGMGLDAAVVERVDSHPKLKARFGPWYFVEAAVSTFLRSYVVNPPRLEVEVDGRTIGGVSVFIQNAERYTYFKDRPVELVAGARFDSGDLAGVVLTRARPYDVPTVTFRALSGAARIAKHKGIAGFAQAKEVAVRSTDGRTIPVHVDGDHILNTLEARFSIAPGALQMVG